MVNTLANQYRNRPVVFVEHDVDAGAQFQGNRRARWAAARARPGSSSLPMVMTDSGHKWTEGSVSFQSVYKGMVDASLAVPPEVVIEAWQERVGIQSALRVHGKITNVGERVLGYDNSTTLNIIVYEERKEIHVDRFVRKAVFADIGADLAPGESYAFDVEVADLGRANMSRVRAIVLVDYRPNDGSVNGYVSANGALASQDPPPEPTEEPEPTDPPTAEPTEEPVEPTEEPTEPAPTEVPTEPAPTTAPPAAGSSIFLPSTRNRS